MPATFRTVAVEEHAGGTVLRLVSEDGTNRLTRQRVEELTAAISSARGPVVLAGNERFFSAGADLNEIAALTGPAAFEFARSGQRLMWTVARHDAPIIAAISGYCMGGGLDLALACDARVCAPNAIFAHRGAALGILTGWGGTQRLPRIIGRTAALRMFLAAEKLHAADALRLGLADATSPDPVRRALEIASR